MSLEIIQTLNPEYTIKSITDEAFRTYGKVIDNNIDEAIENGALVDIITTTGRYLGTGFISKNSHITVRILSKDINEIFDRNFFKNTICL